MSTSPDRRDGRNSHPDGFLLCTGAMFGAIAAVIALTYAADYLIHK